MNGEKDRDRKLTMGAQEFKKPYLFIGGRQTPLFGTRFTQENRRPLLSVVAPAFNEELNLAEFYRQVSSVLETMEVDWEIIFVDDGSCDRSEEIYTKLHERDSRVKAIQFARNFGHQIAISAGLRAASGDAVVIMDSDLQHPVELIPKMYQSWKDGYHVVHTVREYGNKVGFFKKALSSGFYWLNNLLSGTKIEPGAADFKLLDYRVVELLNMMPEKTRFLRALIPWLGFRQTSIPFKCHQRFAGTPSYTSFKSLELAIDGIISFSTKPLRGITYLGSLVLASTVPYGLWAIYEYFFIGTTTPGWTSLVLLNLVLGGSTLISLGVIGEYIGRIYTEVRQRPLFTVEKVLGLNYQELMKLPVKPTEIAPPKAETSPAVFEKVEEPDSKEHRVA